MVASKAVTIQTKTLQCRKAILSSDFKVDYVLNTKQCGIAFDVAFLTTVSFSPSEEVSQNLWWDWLLAYIAGY
jgi:hypothetical protein